MVHYYDHIKDFGSPNGLCSSITESKHITAVKRPWRRSNKHLALPQMLKTNERFDKLAATRADFTARGMLVDSCLVQAIKVKDTMDYEGGLTDDINNGTDSDTDDETWHFDPNPPGPQNLPATSPQPISPSNDLRSPTPHQPSPILLENQDSCPPLPPTSDDNHEDPPPPFTTEEDDDCGPVESGPLMNEVRLTSKKGNESYYE